MTKLAPPGLPVSGGMRSSSPRASARAPASGAVFRMRLEAVDDPAVLADVDVAVVVEHQARHHRVGLLARQARHAHHVGQADAPLAGADGGDDEALVLARILRRPACGPKKKRFTRS